MSKSVLVVGAGFAGAVYARLLAEAGLAVDVIDKRDHIAGNCYDELHPCGVRFHRYGPHLFHTANRVVIDWVTRFGEFEPYEHSVSVKLDAQAYAPLPINIETLNIVFDANLRDEEEAKRFVAGLARAPLSEKNAADYLNTRLGEKLTDTFFRPYTKKMWDLDLEELDAAVVKRIPIRFGRESRYFPDDPFQGLPKNGYHALFQNILDHRLIKVSCGTPFEKGMIGDYDYTFNSMPIDEYFGYKFGPLPYRSLRFHQEVVPSTFDAGPTSVVNFSDASKFTRRTDWAMFPCHRVRHTAEKLLTSEEPCDYKDNRFERYYPVRKAGAETTQILQNYKAEAAKEPNLEFIGRCGTYQYLDMHQVINQSMQGAKRWLAAIPSLGARETV